MPKLAFFLTLPFVLFGCQKEQRTTEHETFAQPSRSSVLESRQVSSTESKLFELKQAEADWKTKIKSKLKLKANNPFQNMPATEIIKILSGTYDVAILVSLDNLDLDQPIDLPLHNMTFEQALNILSDRLDPNGNIGWSLKNGAIFIGEKELFNLDTQLVHYDVRDLIGELKDFRAPAYKGEINSIGQESSSETDEPITGDDLVELIQSTISPNNWDYDNGLSIAIRNGAIVINHTAEVHDEVQDLLSFLRKQRALQVKTHVEYWKLSKKQSLTFRDLNAESEIILNDKQTDYLDKLRRRENIVIDQIQCLCFNTQRSFSGNYTEVPITMRESQNEGHVTSSIARIGTILDIRPIVSHDRKSITSTIRLTKSKITGYESFSLNKDTIIKQPSISQIAFKGNISAPSSNGVVLSVDQSGEDVVLTIMTQELFTGDPTKK